MEWGWGWSGDEGGDGGGREGDIDEMKKESISPDHLPHVHPLLAVLFTATCVLAPMYREDK